MDMSKIQAVAQASTVKELQQFLGFADFYRMFIRNYSLIAAFFSRKLNADEQNYDVINKDLLSMKGTLEE